MKLATKTRRPQQPAKDDPEQSRAFIQKAREIGADQESRAEALLGQLARTPSWPRSKRAKLKHKVCPKTVMPWASVINLPSPR
jgi:hypothetical protein